MARTDLVGLVSSVSKPPRLSPVLAEAAASIIHAAPSTESKGMFLSERALLLGVVSF